MLPVGAQYLFEHVERPAHLVPSLIPGGGRVIRERGGGGPSSPSPLANQAG